MYLFAIITSNSLSICLSSYDVIKLSFVLSFVSYINTLAHEKFTRVHAHAFSNTILRFYLKITDFDELEAKETNKRLNGLTSFVLFSYVSMKLMCMG